MNIRAVLLITAACLIFSCGPAGKINRSARRTMINDPAFAAAHLGVSVFEPATGRYWYNYQGDKYFVPASNTKLPTCYAAMKYLGDSLEGLRVQEQGQTLLLYPTGDPTFLHPDFTQQPVATFLAHSSKELRWSSSAWEDQALGAGWSWSDYSEDYLPERSIFPIYGNLVHITGKADSFSVCPAAFRPSFKPATQGANGYISSVTRAFHANEFLYRAGGQKPVEIAVPFITSDTLALRLLTDTLHLNCSRCLISFDKTDHIETGAKANEFVIHSQPTDSMLTRMMHRSDNFYAEQSLLMVSNKLLHVFNDEKIIDTLLKTDFKDLPQPPRWADGSGLSRYNLFTPQDFVAILNKMRVSFGMERLKAILATGGTGTLSRYFKADAGYIYAKTGSLSGVVALSGYVYTKKNRLLIFSILVNNTRSSATAIRKAEEKFLEDLRSRY